VNRIYVLKTAWHFTKAIGERPSRRNIQEYLKRNVGRKWDTNEIHAFLRAWQYEAEDGSIWLREESCQSSDHSQNGEVSVRSPFQVPHNDHLQSSSYDQNEENQSASSPVSVQFQSARARGTIESKKNVINSLCQSGESQSTFAGAERQRRESSETSPAAKRIRIVEDPVPPVTFGEEEHRVVKMLAAVAAENKSQTLSAGKVARLRAEIRASLDAVGLERWSYGIDQATDREKGWDYAKAVIRKHVEVPKPKLSPKDAAKQEHQDAMERAAQRDYAAMGLAYANGNGKHG
jgi:hypothetical protein